MTRAVQKLQGLHDKLDFADSARPEFYIPIEILVPDDVAFDPPFDRGDFIQQFRRRTLRINKGLMFAQKIVGQLFAAGDAIATVNPSFRRVLTSIRVILDYSML